MQSKTMWGVAALSVLAVGMGNAVAADNLKVRRSDGPVTRIIGDSAPVALSAGDVIGHEQRLLTGSKGRATVLIDGGGSFTLGDETSVRIHSSEASSPPARAALVRMRLTLGVMRVDARAIDTQAPADVRLNLGTLKLRIFGADAWAQTLPSGDEICVMSGAVEVLAPDRAERIDQAGECLRYSAIAGVQRLAPGQVGSLAVRLARTSFADDFPARYRAEQALASGEARPMLGQSLDSPAVDDDAAWRAALDAAADARDTTLRTAAETPAPSVAVAAPLAPAPEPGADVATPGTGTAPEPDAVAVATAVAADAVASSSAEVAVAPGPASVASVENAAPAPVPEVWRIVLASFPDREKADRLAASWRRDGLETDVATVRVGARLTHRVLSGRYANREAAVEAAQPLRQRAGFRQAWVLRETPTP